MARFIDMLTPQALDEDLTSLNISGIGPEEADDFLEKSFWESPEEAQISAGQQNFKEPEKAEPLAKSITAAKESGQPGGIGIVPAIFAGLAGAFSDNGVATTAKLMKEWDPRTQAAQAVKDETARLGMEAKRGEVSDAATARQRAEMERDAGSDVSKQWQTLLAPMSKRLGVDVSAMSASQIKEAFPVLSKQLQAQVDENYQKAMLQQSKDKTEQARLKSERDAAAKVTAAEEKAKVDTRKQQNKILLDEYAVLGTSARKYPQTIRDVDRIIELGDKVETGPIAGSAPAVYLRKLFGDDELQELESLVKGLPLPVLKATFGAAFTVKEGETLAQSLANINMDAETFKNRMHDLRDNIQWEKDEYDAQTAYMKENDGSLIGYQSKSVMGLSDEDREAIKWAKANPDDPRAQDILRLHGQK